MTPDETEARIGRLRSVIHGLGAFARYVQLKRTLVATEPNPRAEFWRIIYGGLTNLAVIEWCKYFGAPRTNVSHWKRIYQDDIDEFRLGLVQSTGLSEDAFRTYWSEVKSWRDTDFAHSDPDAQKPSKYPDFAIALKAADYYYDRVYKELSELSHFFDIADLKHYRKVFNYNTASVAERALNATRI